MKELRIDGLRARAPKYAAILIMCVIGVAAPMATAAVSVTLASRAGNASLASLFGHANGLVQGSGDASGTGSAGLALPPGSAASMPTSATGSVLLRFSPLYMGGSQRFTQTDAISIAKQFNVIAEHAGVVTPYISAMKAANPSLKIVAYINGAFDQSTGGTSYPTTWYARDSKGNRIKSVSFGNWLMYPSTLWGSKVAANCAAAITKSKYDGCFLDTLGLGPLLPGYVTGIPIDLATKKAFTAPAWISAQSGTVSAVERGNPGAVVVTNGLASGAKYFSSGGSTKPLLVASH